MKSVLCLLATVIMLSLPAILFGQWSFAFYRTGGLMPYGFGTDPIATNWFDIWLDQAAPPPPMAGFDGCFPNDPTDTLYVIISRLLMDIRPITDTVRWQFYVQWMGGSAAPETLIWNTTEAPDEYGRIHLDTLPDMSTAIDMSTFGTMIIYHYPMTLYLTFIEGEGVEESQATKPREITICAYPNPFNSSCEIRIRGMDESRIQGIEIYDLHGNRAWKSPHSSFLLKRDGSKVVETSGLIWTPGKSEASGIYFIRATINDAQTITKSILYVR